MKTSSQTLAVSTTASLQRLILGEGMGISNHIVDGKIYGK
jgi:hypothetical protein